MRKTVLLAVSLLALVVAATPTQAHGLVNAGELEILLLQDEASDVMTEGRLGYDLVQVYLGEAHVPGLGDGVYVHTILYGGADGEASIAFTFSTDTGGTFTRTITTTDGITFTSDFDQLVTLIADGALEIQRAFVANPPGVTVGTKLSVTATSSVDGQPRDIAPGGTFLPVLGDLLEIPQGDSTVVASDVPLRGPGIYLDVTITSASNDGHLELTARNPLKTGDQHIMLRLPTDLAGWTVISSGGGEVKAGQTTNFTFDLKPGEGPLAFDVLSDIGGRVTIDVEPDGKTFVYTTSEGASTRPGEDGELAVPVPLAVPLVALALAALVARKAQR